MSLSPADGATSSRLRAYGSIIGLSSPPLAAPHDIMGVARCASAQSLSHRHPTPGKVSHVNGE